MDLKHLPASASAEDVAATMKEFGYAIVDELAPAALMDELASEMDPYIENSMFGTDSFLGMNTKRTGALIPRSPAARRLITDPTALGTAAIMLRHASTYQLHLTQIISVYPGSPAQKLHQDEVAWDFFPFPKDYDIQCNILWALSDYTEEMGATRVVPGSHLDSRKKYDVSESAPAVMKRGSALFYTGKVFHGAGQNKSDRGAAGHQHHLCRRLGPSGGEPVSLHAARSCKDPAGRSAEADGLPTRAASRWAYVRDGEDPMVAIREPEKRVRLRRRSAAADGGDEAAGLAGFPSRYRGRRRLRAVSHI